MGEGLKRAKAATRASRFPTAAEKAKRTLLGIELPRDELALKIAQGCIGLVPPAGESATAILDQMDLLPLADPTCPPMGAGFRRAADLAVAYFAERINAAKQPH